MMNDDKEHTKSFAEERADFLKMIIFIVLPTTFMSLTLFFFIASRTPMGLPRVFGEVADYSAASLAHRNFEVTLDEDDFVAELDANGALRLGRNVQGQVRQAIPGGWSWSRQAAGADAGLCLGGDDASAGAHCYRLSTKTGELLRPDGTRFGRIVAVSKPEIVPRARQDIRDITGR